MDGNNGEKRLKRSLNNRMIAGVCGGVAEYINIDPKVVRLIWAIASFFSLGAGFIIYIIAVFIIPEEEF